MVAGFQIWRRGRLATGAQKGRRGGAPLVVVAKVQSCREVEPAAEEPEPKSIQDVRHVYLQSRIKRGLRGQHGAAVCSVGAQQPFHTLAPNNSEYLSTVAERKTARYAHHGYEHAAAWASGKITSICSGFCFRGFWFRGGAHLCRAYLLAVVGVQLSTEQ